MQYFDMEDDYKIFTVFVRFLYKCEFYQKDRLDPRLTYNLFASYFKRRKFRKNTPNILLVLACMCISIMPIHMSYCTQVYNMLQKTEIFVPTIKVEE